jgi:hypothetical protein
MLPIGQMCTLGKGTQLNSKRACKVDVVCVKM